MEIHILRSMVTVVSFLTFVGILIWACLPSRKTEFAEAAQLPFLDDDQAERGKHE